MFKWRFLSCVVLFARLHLVLSASIGFLPSDDEIDAVDETWAWRTNHIWSTGRVESTSLAETFVFLRVLRAKSLFVRRSPPCLPSRRILSKRSVDKMLRRSFFPKRSVVSPLSDGGGKSCGG